MNNEIEEILYVLKHKVIGRVSRLTCREADKLLDCITNLQEENERLKRQLNAKEKLTKIMPEDTEFIILTKADYERQEKEIELVALEQKNRINKAIEYIKKNYGILLLTNPPREAFSKDILLNILQGESND